MFINVLLFKLKDKKKKYEPPIPTRVGKRKKKTKGPDAASKLPLVTPHTQCRLKLLKQERIKDYLLMEEEFIRNQEQMKPLEEKQEEERSKVDDLRGTPMSVGTLEEIIDDNHAIVSTSVGSEHYVSILSFVDKDLLEPGCSVLLNHKVHAVIGVLMDDTDPLVTVMKVEKAPQETYADIGGLDNQIQEIKVSWKRLWLNNSQLLLMNITSMIASSQVFVELILLKQLFLGSLMTF
uniref:Proteasome 26S subunit, ATPase 1 n=1 Tax=Nothobranchius furzeri TaxID=105023 RepID=A0A8C6P193_NOTFU